jgi:hypothetical protein
MNNPLDSARTELQALLVQKSLIDKKIAAIQQTIKILEPTYGQDPLSTLGMNLLLTATANELGLTFAIRKVLESRPNTELSPVSVRDHAIIAGYSFEGRSNPMAEIHQILKRLVDSDPRFVAVPIGDVTCYKFDPNIPAPTLNRRRRPAQPQPPAPMQPQPPEREK